MNRNFFSLIIIAVVAVAALATGWQIGNHRSVELSARSSAGRKILFYQSPMHPWIKSDKPGTCTICGMKLVPVFEGDADSQPMPGDAVKLSAHSVSAIRVESAPVLRQPMRRTIRVAGMIEDDDSAHRRLSAYVDGRIDKLFVNFVGAEVTAGQPLAALYSRDLLVARSEYAQAVRQPQNAQSENFLNATRQKLRRMGLTLEQIEKLPGDNGDTFNIVAPISGTVVERKVYEGQYVKEGDVLFEIGDFSKMWFVFDAYERDLAWIRVGERVDITTPSVPGKTFTAPIAFIDPTLVNETRSAKVRVVLDNAEVGAPGVPRHELLHKIFADGRIRVETGPILTVPRSAVLSPGGEPFVYVEKSEREYEQRRVTLGRAGDDVWEVLAGLSEGERVVTTGNLLIDSQAQLDRPQPIREADAPAAALVTDAQHAAAEKFIAAAADVADALASDDLAAHNTRIETFRTAAMALSTALGERGKKIAMLAEAASTKDLAAARRQFYPLGMAVAELAAQWRRHEPGFGDVKIFECPMAQTAVPSADTNQGRWVQMKGAIRNPFFGAEMLTCGTEVKP